MEISYVVYEEEPAETVNPAGEPEEMRPGAWVEQRLGLRLDAQQRRVVESGSKRGILNCCRQWGKSTTSAAKAVHEAMRQRGA